MKKNILIYDSGIGGLFLYSKILKTFKDINAFYFADNKNLPYGDKTKTELLRIAKQNVRMFLDLYHIDYFVFACNTLSINTIRELELEFGKIFFGVFPPLDLEKKHTLFLSTEATYKALKQDLRYENVYCSKDIAKKIEENLNSSNCLDDYLRIELSKFEIKNIHSIILGCTHFNFIKNNLRKIFKQEFFFYSGEDGVLASLKKRLPSSKNKSPKSNFIFSKYEKGIRKKYNLLFNSINSFEL